MSVLFTDLVGSTALAAALGPEETERLRHIHFGLLRDAVSACGGREVKNLGDGIMAVFGGAAGALDAAAAVQQGVARLNRADDHAPIAIRIGVATGDCTEEDGDYFGEPVVQAARLCAAAEGDEILATAVFRYLVPRDGYDLEDVGELELKGLPEPVPAVRVGWSVPEEEAHADDVPLQPRLTVEHLAGLVGREAERGLLDDAMKAAAAGERRVVLITGEAGLGKTRLTAEFARRAHDDGALVLYGRCDEELAVPYLPWIEALGHWAEHARPGALDTLDEGSRSQLSRLLPSLHERLGTASDLASVPADQYALVAAVTRLLAAIAAGRTTLVILDDLHWADDASLLLLRQVVTSLPDAPLMVVGTYRDTDLGPDDALTDTSARLHREPGVQRINLTGLSDVEVVELLEAAAGHEIDERGAVLAHSLRADSAGNPFFVVEMLRHLVEAGAIVHGEDGRWTVAVDLDTLTLPQSVRDVVGQRVRRLGGQAHAVLTAGAVIGREFDCTVVTRATDLGEDEILDVLEEAMAAGLIAEVHGADERFTFTHALVQHTLYSDLSDARRARMHRRVATAIEDLVGDEPGNRVGELAKHWFAAVRPSELERAISYAVRAGDRALDASAPEEAVRWYTQALDAIDEDHVEERCEIEVRLGEAERRAGRPAFRQRFLDAARVAEEVGRDDVLVEAAINNYRGLHSVSGDLDVERVAVLEAALASPAGQQPANRARLLATLAGELAYTGDVRRFGMADEAAEIARELDDDEVLVDALERVGGGLYGVPGLLATRDARTQEAVALTQSRSDPVRRFYALDRRTLVCIELADMDEARAMSAERAEIAEQLGEPGLRWLATQGTALLDLVEGDLDRATDGTGTSLELALETGQPDASVYFGALMLQMLWHRGTFDDTIPVVRKGIEDNPGVSAYRPVLALFCFNAGRDDEARSVVEELAAEGFEFPPDLLWMTSTVFAAEAVHLAGHVEGASLLYDRLAPAADHVATTRITCSGPVSYTLGLLASTLGRPQEAEACHRDAIERAVGLRSPFHRVRPMLALAELTRSTAPDESRALVAEARELVERFAIGGVARQLEALSS